MTKTGLASVAGAFVVLASSAANAQPQFTSQADSPQWLKDRRYTEGVGVRAGDFELHPGIAGEAGYDSNYFQRSNQNNVDNGPPNAPAVPAVELRLTPSLYLSTVGAERRSDEGSATAPAVAFRAGVNATYRAFFGVTSDAKQGQNDINGQNNVGGAADARLDILPGRPFSSSIWATYGRVILPNEGNSNPDISFNQDNVTAGVDFALQPGSGTLDWHIGYQFATTLFEETEGQPFTNYSNEAYTRGRWRFRPRTALLYDATFDVFSYSNPNEARSQGLVSSTPTRVRLGMNGLVTDRFAVLAMLGWGASFGDDKVPHVQQFDSLIAQAELKWYLTASPGLARAMDLGLALSSISVGFTRDFQNSYLANFDTLDRGYLKFDYLFAGRVALQLQGGVGAVEYPTMYWINRSMTGVLAADFRGNAFTDVVADASAFAEYRFTNTFGLNATFRYTQTFSNTTVAEIDPALPGGTPAPPAYFNQFGMAWQRFEAFIGLRWFL